MYLELWETRGYNGEQDMHRQTWSKWLPSKALILLVINIMSAMERKHTAVNILATSIWKCRWKFSWLCPGSGPGFIFIIQCSHIGLVQGGLQSLLLFCICISLQLHLSQPLCLFSLSCTNCDLLYVKDHDIHSEDHHSARESESCSVVSYSLRPHGLYRP